MNWAFSVIWIQFWPPFYAILNYIACIVSASTMSSVHEGVTSKGLSIFTNLGLQNFSNDTYALAGYLCLSVPFLSYIILQGGLNQFVQLAGTLTSPSQGAASSAAIEQTSGNYSYDNISVGQTSYGNTTAFQTNTAPSVSDGYFLENKGHERTEYTSSGVYYNQNASNLTSSINADQVFGESLQHQIQHAESYAETASQHYQESVAQSVNTGTSLIHHLAHADNLNEGTSTREAYDVQQAVRHMESAADQWGSQFGLGSKESLDFAMAGAVGASFGGSVGLGKYFSFGGNISGSGSGSYNFGADESKVLSSAVNFANSEEFQTGFQKVKDYAKTVGVSSSMDEGDRLARDFVDSLNQTKTSQEAYQAAKTHLDQVSDTGAWYEQNSHLIKDNLNQKYVDWAENKFNEEYQDGTGFERFKAISNSSDPADVCQRQALIYEFVQSEIDKQAGISNPVNYRDPSTAYSEASVTKIDYHEMLKKQMNNQSENDAVFKRSFSSIEENQQHLDHEFEKSTGTQDAYAYFSENEIKQRRNGTVGRFEVEAERGLWYRGLDGTSSGHENASNYQIDVPFFLKRGD